MFDSKKFRVGLSGLKKKQPKQLIQLSGKNAQNPQQKYQTASNLVKFYYKSLT